MSRILFVLLFVSMAAFGAEDKAYQITLPNGTVEFTDKPQAGAKEITVPQTQTYQAAPVPPLTATPAKPAAKPAFSYSEVAITAPTADQTFHRAEGNIAVQVQIKPRLRSGDTVTITLDGQSVASGKGGGFSLHDVARGTHVVVAEVRNANGQSVQSSAPVTFHVFQYSKLFKKH